MDSPYLTLNSQNIDYTKNPDLIFNICQNELNHHAPRKKMYITGSDVPFMTKTLSKYVIERTRFNNKFLKDPTDEKKISFYETKNILRISSQKIKKKTIFCIIKWKEYHW